VVSPRKDHDLVTHIGVAVVRSTRSSRDPISMLITVHVAWKMGPAKTPGPGIQVAAGVSVPYVLHEPRRSLVAPCVYIYIVKFINFK
jgi:hypothetical protein